MPGRRHEGARRGEPLSGIAVLELAGIGPGPFCAVMLADMGGRCAARAAARAWPAACAAQPTNGRGMRSIELDLKTDAGRDAVLRLVPSTMTP